MRPGEPATFVQRLLAYLLQSAVGTVVLVPVVALGFLLLVVGLFSSGDPVGPGAELVFGLVSMAVMLGLSFGYQLWVVWWTGRRVGQDYGKHVLHIVIVDADTGLPGIGFGRAFLRVLAMMVSALPLYLGFLWPLFDDERRTWHDILTRTRVVYAGEHRIRGPLEFLRTLDVPVEPPVRA